MATLQCQRQAATVFFNNEQPIVKLFGQSATVFFGTEKPAVKLYGQSVTVFWGTEKPTVRLYGQSAIVFWGADKQIVKLFGQQAVVFYSALPPTRILAALPEAIGGDIRSLLYGIDEDIDYAQDALGLVMDDGLETAVILSLFTDRRAEPDDVIPDGSQDRRGWWGDDFNADSADRIGSRLWLLHREKQLSVVLQRAQSYAEEALRWLIDDGVAESVTVVASIPRKEILGFDIAIQRPHHPVAQYRFEVFWGLL
jgi:phage gp46-like protein